MHPFPDADLPQPPLWRVIPAFLIAPFSSSLLLACWEPLYQGLPMTERITSTTETYYIFYALPVALILGIPVFSFLRHRVQANWLNGGIAGGGIAVMPLIIFILPCMMCPGTNSYAQVGHHVVEINGHTTLWGWWNGLCSAAQIWAIGFAGGLTFWLVAAAKWSCPFHTKPA
jgi:hypothetical protein